jgi:hypothetical protein
MAGDDLRASQADDLTSETATLEGWAPVVGDTLSLEEVIDLAFDYRGDVTVVHHDGSRIVGYLFNRNGEGPEPFVQMFDRAGNGPFTIPYAKIATISFTGKDTAAGKSYEAWVRRKGERQPADSASGSARGA